MIAKEEAGKLSATAQRFCRRFSFAQIQLATRDFSKDHLIGNGGFGKVYKAQLDNGEESVCVAIKRLAPNSNQGETEFLTEIETLSKVQHINLVSLIGYCNENHEMILVYEYIPRGTLAHNLYKLSRSSDSDSDGSSFLTWKQRLNICIGAARGLDYLHTGTSIIHRDVKSTNILLDENFRAKVSDFGLAKHLSTINPQSHVSTIVKGSFGYLDPSYFTTCRLTKQSDTYAFGVVLLEVLCGRPAVDSRLGEDEMSLVMWAQDKIKKGKVGQIVTSYLKEEITADCLKTFVGIAKRCLNHDPKKRPTMGHVLGKLELALEQQDRKAQTFVALRFLSLWSSTKPSGNMNCTCIPANQLGIITIKQVPLYVSMSYLRIFWPKLAGSLATGSTQDRVDVSMPSEAVPATQEDSWKEEQSSTTVDEDKSDVKLAINVEPIVCHAIPTSELFRMTHNFRFKCLIGVGSSSRVYRGELKSGQVVAIMELIDNHLPDNKFLEQVSITSNLKHENVAPLLGYCVAGGQHFLAYEFAQNGTLHDILHGHKGTNSTKAVPALSWDQRVKIAFGVAKGLEYIHQKKLIHRNIRSSNIFLFDDYKLAKLSDFGWFTQSPDPSNEDTDYYHPSVFDRPCGYHPPDYVWFGRMSYKTDVYSFGVLLLELLTGRRVSDSDDEHEHIVNWATPWLEKDAIQRVVDARLIGAYPPDDASKMAEVARMCVQYHLRPEMDVVISNVRPLLKATSA